MRSIATISKYHILNIFLIPIDILSAFFIAGKIPAFFKRTSMEKTIEKQRVVGINIRTNIAIVNVTKAEFIAGKKLVIVSLKKYIATMKLVIVINKIELKINKRKIFFALFFKTVL
ncbi:hypothetical protein GAMM_60057 [Gammaproteobacteria bacterium]